MSRFYRNVAKRASCLLLALLIILPLNFLSAAPAEAFCIVHDTTSQSSTSSNTSICEIDNGDTLAEVAQSLLQQDFESVAGFDNQGNKLFNYTCYQKSHATITVRQLKDFLSQSGTLMVHNHPNSGHGFSVQDLWLFAKYQIPRMMVIGDIYTYTIEAGAEGWCDAAELYDYYTAKHAEYVLFTVRFCQGLTINRKTLLATPDSPDDGSFEWFYLNEAKQSLLDNADGDVSIRVGLWASHHALMDTAEEFGLIYQRTANVDFDFDDPAVFAFSTG